MAQLKDSIVSGNLRVTDTTLTDTLHVTTIKAPTSSGGTTYGPGTSGQILKSNGTMTYWTDMPTIPTVNNASLALKGAGTTVTTFTANSSTNQSLDIVAGTNVTITPDATNHKITIASSYTNTDTKVNVTLATTSKAYLLGTTTTPTGTATGVTSVADTGVYLTTTAGELCATKFMTSGKNGYYTHDADNAKFPLVYNNASNLWVGAEGSTSYPHKGQTFISAGWDGTLPTTAGETLAGNSTIIISVPKYTAGSNGGTWSHTPYYVLHTGNTSVTTTGSGNAITALSFSNGTFTATKGSTFSLSNHTHSNYLGAVKIGSYYGMADPDGTDTHWIRTSTLGIIPATSVSLANGGDGSLGTSVWAFKDAYVANINGVAVGSSPKFTDANVLQSNTETTDYRPILFGKTQTTTIADLSATVTGQAYVSSKMFAKPDTGKLYASEFITSGYINGAGSDLTQYGLYLRSYKTESLPAGGDYDYSRYAVRTYGGKSGENSGMLLEMGGGGLTIVGAGESASFLAALISDDQRDSNTSRTRLDVGGTLNTSLNGSSEQLILSSDNNIYFLTACNTIANRKPVCLDTSSYFYPGTNKTGSIGTSSYMWNSVYATTIYENGASLASKYAAIGHTHSNYLGAVKIGSYYGMAWPDGTDKGNNSWIRTTRLGIIPYAKNDDTTDGNVSSLGTSIWTFAAGYINDLYYKDLKTVTVVAGNTADNAIDKMAGSFFFSGTGLFGGVNDWVGIQAGYDNDKFQLTANGTSGVLYRQNDTGGTNTANWTAIKNLMTPEAVSGQNGITVTKRTNTLGTGSTALTYDSGVIIGHSNSVTAVTSAVFKKITYDAQGHITGTANVTASDLPSHTHNYAGSSSAGGPATEVATTVTNGTEDTARYGIAFVGVPGTSNAQAVLKNNDFRFNMSNGTNATGNTGHAEIVLGNSTPSGTAGNKKGVLTLYSTGSHYGNLNTGTLTANRTHTLPDADGTIKLEKRSMMYDDTSDWASYSWHKFAEITSSTNYDDKAITFLVSRTYDTDYSGILSVHVRMNGSKNYQKHQFKWLIADEYIDPNNFVLVYTNNGTTSCKIELWYKQSQIYEGWIFEVLKEHTRMASENAWTVYTTSGHGSATYTAGTNHYASELACVQSKTALYTVKGTHTTTTNAWTGEIDATALYDGMTIAYYLPYSVSPSASVTLNLTLSNGTTTGAINCYQNNTTRITTHYGAGSTIILTYWSAGSISVAGTATTDNRWTRCDYNSNNSVTQNNTTTSASYRVIFSGNANDTNETTTVRKNANLQFNPNTATLSIGKAGTKTGSIVFNSSGGGSTTIEATPQTTTGTYLLPACGNGIYTLSIGMMQVGGTGDSLVMSNVSGIPSGTISFKIVFKSNATSPIYSMVEIPYIGDGVDCGGLIQVGDYSDGTQGSPRIVMKGVVIRVTAGSTTGTKTFTATVTPTQKINGSTVSEYTRNVIMYKIYACT